MEELLAKTGAKGLILDTRGESNSAFQQAADKVDSGIIMYSEGMAVPKNMQGIVAGRVHNALYYPPLLNLNKFIKPEFAIFRVAEIFKEPIRREFAVAFFNGYGTEINQFAPGKPEWVEEQYRYLGKTTRILRENSTNFTSKGYVPLVESNRDSVYINFWPQDNKYLYTILNMLPQGYSGPLMEVKPQEGYHYVDLWNHEEQILQENDGKTYLKVNLEPFNTQWQGTNNEGSLGCIARLPEYLKVSLHGDNLRMESHHGTEIRVWAGNPAYDKEPVVLETGTQEILLLKHFGRYEGKLVIQLFSKGILLDERVAELKPGTPRLASRVIKTQIHEVSEEMVEIPAGSFTFQSTHGDGFIPYPDYRQGEVHQIPKFLMDRHPVTNLDFQRFLDATAYRPKDTVNFLKHWQFGTFPKGEEHFPVVYVSYEDATAFAEWAKKRLPTEIEWQYAAQTPDLRSWPWGGLEGKIYREEEPVTETLTKYTIKGIDPGLCNPGNGMPDPVGAYPNGANPYGLEDLVGSVWQLTNDWYQSGSYDYIMLKGGSYFNPSSSWWYIQGGPRELHYSQHLLRVSQGFERNATVGFRCVRDL
jgi:formylglycine-generating enzyme required for sulfatase activity